MNLSLDKIRVFHAVANAGSLTKASLTLGLSQSALSRNIHTIESQLGVSLFHRHARGLTLTEQGDILYLEGGDILRKLNSLEARIEDSRSKAEGSLKITAPRFLGDKWLMPYIEKFRAQYPNVRLNFILTNKLFDLSTLEADIALRFYEPEQPNLIKRKVNSFAFSICASEDYLIQHGRPEKISDLKDHTLIGYPDGIHHPHPHTDWLFNIAHVNKDRDQNILLINSMSGITELVCNNNGIACLPDFMINDKPNIQKILTNFEPPLSDLYLVYAAERRQSEKVSVFRKFMLDVIKG